LYDGSRAGFLSLCRAASSCLSSRTFPGHRFLFTEEEKPDEVLVTFVIQKYPENVYFYDPYLVEGDPVQTEKNLEAALKGDDERKRYEAWNRTRSFNEQYKARTGRSYLANYLRNPPIHYMWPADFFGQEHWVTTRETHFTELPPADKLGEIAVVGRKRILKEGAPRLLHEYRDSEKETMNMTLKVLSCAPRVFEIQNFLSPVEVDHILELAGGINLHLSRTGEQEKGEKKVKEEDRRRTRTSYNSWVPREKTPIIDAVYRRAADLMRIDEALLRWRAEEEYPEHGMKTMAGR